MVAVYSLPIGSTIVDILNWLSLSHHREEKQSLDNRRMWKLAEINGVRCLTMMNGMMGRLSNRKWRGLLGRYIFGVKEEE
jgi:hypothetical protein